MFKTAIFGLTFTVSGLFAISSASAAQSCKKLIQVPLEWTLLKPVKSELFSESDLSSGSIDSLSIRPEENGRSLKGSHEILKGLYELLVRYEAKYPGFHILRAGISLISDEKVENLKAEDEEAPLKLVFPESMSADQSGALVRELISDILFNVTGIQGISKLKATEQQRLIASLLPHLMALLKMQVDQMKEAVLKEYLCKAEEACKLGSSKAVAAHLGSSLVTYEVLQVLEEAISLLGLASNSGEMTSVVARDLRELFQTTIQNFKIGFNKISVSAKGSNTSGGHYTLPTGTHFQTRSFTSMNLLKADAFPKLPVTTVVNAGDEDSHSAHAQLEDEAYWRSANRVEAYTGLSSLPGLSNVFKGPGVYQTVKAALEMLSEVDTFVFDSGTFSYPVELPVLDSKKLNPKGIDFPEGLAVSGVDVQLYAKGILNKNSANALSMPALVQALNKRYEGLLSVSQVGNTKPIVLGVQCETK